MYRSAVEILKNKAVRTLLSVGAGTVLGFMYYHFIGCQNSCPLTSSPWTSMFAGGAMAYLFMDNFIKNGRQENRDEISRTPDKEQ